MSVSEITLAVLLALQAGLRPVQIPSALSALTSNPELSGIVWAPTLQRYLLVSDDTGRSAEGSNHAPWAFSMASDGQIDASPIPLLGPQKLNDAEAICAGSAGAFFITTSHSKNKKGHVPASRRTLALAELAGRELRIVGSVDLTTARAADGSGLLALAGLDPAGALDIEALAFRNDELFVGLKSPLTPTGDATILKIANASSTVRGSALPVGGVTRWKQVQMCLQGPQGRVCQGISDMTFLPDGSLALLGNAPKLSSLPDGGGALWHLANPSGPDRVPRLVRHFDNLKPEGVTLSNDGGSVAIVFDRDRQQPLWMRWPIPL